MSITELRTGLTAATLDAGESAWRKTRHPGISWRPLYQAGDGEGGDATVLIRMEPGSSYPEHEHVGVEEVLVLAGGYRDGEGEHLAGSYLRYPAGSLHAPIAIGDPSAAAGPMNPACILFAVAHGGVRSTAVEAG